jgi:type VI secretion system protein ImpM
MPTAGWFGKIPALGDFASRRLPQEFIAVWDFWLQHGMAASRASLGDRWLEYYLTSPIWYFDLFPGIIGSQAWTGLLMPSVDKVGRHFPLTIAAPLDPTEGSIVAMFERQDWYARLGQIALGTLSVDYPVERLEADLDANPFPVIRLDGCSAAARNLADWWQTSDVPEVASALESQPVMGNLLNATGHHLLDTAGHGRSLWWRHSVDCWPQVVRGFRGLPPEGRFESLIEDT